MAGANGAPQASRQGRAKKSKSNGNANAQVDKKDIKQWVTGDKDGLNPQLLQKLAQIGKQLGEKVSIDSGARSRQEQEVLYQKYLNGTGNLAAKPGYSNHQNGIAMDVSGVCGRGTAADRWLRANAASYGFRNLPSEFWHYDFAG